MKTWRAKSSSIKLTGSKQLVITKRRFKTAAASRSKRQKQLVIPVYFSAVKEVAFKVQAYQRQPRPLSAKRLALPRQALLSALLIVGGLSGTAYFWAQATEANKLAEPPKSFSKPVEALKAKPKYLPKSVPTNISIPAIGLESGIMTVGTAPDGTIAVPPPLEWIAGWYDGSPTPGEKGPSVIVGHVDNYKGISVFWRLRELKADDVVSIRRADGQVAKFKVTALKQFDQNNFPKKEVYGNIDHAGLRLITCAGAFDKTTGNYTQNTVVYASMVK